MVEPGDPYPDYLKAHRDIRNRHWNYYERLALIDGGTIALVATTVLGSLHAQLKHKYTLAIGLGMLLVAMCCLLVRNLEETRRETLLASQDYCTLANNRKLADAYQVQIDRVGKRTKPLEMVGVYFTIGGVGLLGAVLILSVL
jgi:hypothetical protein